MTEFKVFVTEFKLKARPKKKTQNPKIITVIGVKTFQDIILI